MGWNISSVVFQTTLQGVCESGFFPPLPFFPALPLQAYCVVAVLGDDESGCVPWHTPSTWCIVRMSLMQAWFMLSVLCFRDTAPSVTGKSISIVSYGQMGLLECHHSQLLWFFICRYCPELHCSDSCKLPSSLWLVRAGALQRHHKTHGISNKHWQP